MDYKSSKTTWDNIKKSLEEIDEVFYGQIRPIIKNALEPAEELLTSKASSYYKKPEIIVNDDFIAKFDKAVDTIREDGVNKAHDEIISRIDNKAKAGFQLVQTHLNNVNGEKNRYKTSNDYDISPMFGSGGDGGIKAKNTSKLFFDDMFSTFSAADPTISQYYQIEANKLKSGIKGNIDLTEDERAKKLAELESSESAKTLYEKFRTTIPEYVYPPTAKQIEDQRRAEEEARKKAEEEAKKAQEKAWWDIGKQILESVAVTVTACFVPVGTAIAAGYVAAKMAATALNGNVVPWTGEKVEGFMGYASMLLDVIPGGIVGGASKLAKFEKVGTTLAKAQKIMTATAKGEKVFNATTKIATKAYNVYTKADKIWNNRATQMAVTAVQTGGDWGSVALAGLTGDGGKTKLGGKIKALQPALKFANKIPAPIKAFGNTIRNSWSGVKGGISNINNYLGNKITASARNIRNKILNSRPVTHLNDKISDLTMKARSLVVKNPNYVPRHVMAFKANNEPKYILATKAERAEKLERLRREKAEKTREHIKVDSSFDNFDPKTATSIQKGNFGENVTHAELMNMRTITIDGETYDLDLERISVKDVASLHTPTAKGIDGIYKNGTPPPDFIINESKFGKSGLKNTKTMGRQMSAKWIETNLRKELGDDNPLVDKIVNSLKKGKSLPLLSKIDAEGNVTFKQLNKSGYITQTLK